MTRALPPIVVAATDHAILSNLADACARSIPEVADYLARELDRARVMAPERVPATVVTMNASVRFRDDQTGEVRTVVLAYPAEQDIAAGRISVMTPIGAALIGLAEGQSITWDTRRGERRALTVLEVGRA